MSVSRKARCGKEDGVVQVKNELITWFPDKPGAESTKRVPIASIKKIMRTQENSKRALIKVVHENGELNIEFITKANKPSFDERAAVDQAIQSFWKEYKQKKQASAQVATAPQEAPADEPKAGAAAPEVPKEAPPLKPRAARPSVEIEANLSPEERSRRRDILRSHPEINELHKRLVIGKQVTDPNFWKFIAHRLDRKLQEKQAARSAEIRKGIPTALDGATAEVDPSGTAQKFTLTAARRNQIFVQHPEVELAFKASVPKKMDEKQFWETYLKSRYFHESRGGTATEADKLFSQYETQAAEILAEEARSRKSALTVQLNLDMVDDHRLVHVRDVHEEGSSNLKHDMYLPKLQQLNRHGKLVLDTNSSVGAKQTVWQGDEEEIRHPMPDLEDENNDHLVPLTLGNRQHFLEGIGASAQASSSRLVTDRKRLREFSRDFESWTPQLSTFEDAKPAALNVYNQLFTDRERA